MASKSSLKNCRQYSRVFVENDQSREERLTARNFRTLVTAMTGGSKNISFRGNRVVRNTEEGEQEQGRTTGETRGLIATITEMVRGEKAADLTIATMTVRIIEGESS